MNLPSFLAKSMIAPFNESMKYKFSDYVLDTDAHSLSHNYEDQRIEPQVFDLLLLLLKNAGDLVSKDQLIDEIWDGRIVSESAISARIAAARKVIGDDGKRQAFIRTVPRRGLQFVAEVTNDKPVQEIPTPSQSQKIRFATADDGVKIAFATSGSGPPLLRVAHHPTHLELEWTEPVDRALFDALGAKNTLIRMDKRGSGLSDLDVDDFGTERTARDMKSVVDALGLKRFSVFGTSSGAMAAVEFATMFPEHVSHLVTLGGYVDGRSVREEELGANPIDPLLTMAKEGWDTPNSAFISGFLSVYMPTAKPEYISRIAQILQNSCPIENEILGRDYFNHHSIANLLDQVQAPTLVMHSQGDVVHPLSEAKKLARGIAGAQLMVLESRNHYPMPEEKCWHTMLAEMQDFIEN